MRIGSFLAKRNQNKWLLSLTFGTIVGVVVLAAILAWAGLGNVWSNFKTISLIPLLAYVSLSFCTYFLRALRFRILVNRGTTFKFYCIVSVHTLMINLLPFSSGEISYPVLLKRYGVSDGFLQGIPSLLIARVQDVFVNLCVVLVALVWSGHLGTIAGLVHGKILVLAGLGLLAAAGIVWLGIKKASKVNPTNRIKASLNKLASSFRETTPLTWVTTSALSILIRLVTIVAVYYLFLAVGVVIPLSAILLITGLYVFLPLLPVNTLGGIGITEAYLVTLFMVSGLDQAASAAASVQVHSLQLGVAAALGAIGLILLELLKRHRPAAGRMVLAPDGADGGS